MTIQQNYPNSRPSLNLNFGTSTKLDPIVTFSRPEIEDEVNGATQINRSGAIEIVPVDTARFDHDPATLEPRGLLVEKGSTNQLRNNIMQGAAIGSPGTVPTYWDFGTSAGGISRSIVGVGQEDGINYFDVRFTGTSTGNPNTYFAFYPEEVNHIPATASSIFTFSSYVKMIAGSVPANSSFILVFLVRDSGNNNLGQYQTFTVPLNDTTSKRLIENRYSLTNTPFTGSVAYMSPYYQWNVANGSSVDVTLRIGLPQCESGSVMSSIILSTGTQDGTRATETVSIEGDNFSKWYNPSEGSILWRGTIHSLPISGSRIFQIYNSSTDTAIVSVTVENNGLMYMRVRKTNETIQLYNLGTVSLGSEYRIGLGVDGSSLCLAVNDEIKTTINDSFALSPADRLILTDLKDLGENRKFTTRHTGLSYYPSRLPNEILRTLTK